MLAIISKAPEMGKVKTRLVPPLTPHQAAELHAAFLKDMSASIDTCAKTINESVSLGCFGEFPPMPQRQRRGMDGAPSSVSTVEGRINNPNADIMGHPARPFVQGAVVYTPVGAEHVFNGLLPGDFILLAQGEGDLGARLSKAVGDLLSLGASSVCLLNSDSPTLPVAALEQAVRSLSAPGERVVLGPAEDGGYYLIGLKSRHRRLFERIAWSTDVVLAETMDRAGEIGLQVELLQAWFDVDDEAGLRRLMQPAVNIGAGEASEAVHSRRVLARFFPGGVSAGAANEPAAEAEVA